MGLCPFGGWELGLHLTQCGQGEAYLRAKFYLDLFNRLATIHQRQTGETERTTVRQDRANRFTNSCPKKLGRSTDGGGSGLKLLKIILF